ncbi:MAG: preprotein translocase subunit YajC [Planctomycetota bacterium]|jgi:preprotein translocase subunit YajC
MFEIDITSLMLAQELPPAPGESGAPSTGEGVPIEGADGAQGGQRRTDPGVGGNSFFFLLLIVFGAMILFSFMGQRRDRKKRQAMISAVKKHDRVQTAGGIIGSIVELKPDTVVLKVDEASNTRITFARSAIQQVLTTSPEVAVEKAGDE